jgi:hypothetical protein
MADITEAKEYWNAYEWFHESWSFIEWHFKISYR